MNKFLYSSYYCCSPPTKSKRKWLTLIFFAGGAPTHKTHPLLFDWLHFTKLYFTLLYSVEQPKKTILQKCVSVGMNACMRGQWEWSNDFVGKATNDCYVYGSPPPLISFAFVFTPTTPTVVWLKYLFIFISLLHSPNRLFKQKTKQKGFSGSKGDSQDSAGGGMKQAGSGGITTATTTTSTHRRLSELLASAKPDLGRVKTAGLSALGWVGWLRSGQERLLVLVSS